MKRESMRMEDMRIEDMKQEFPKMPEDMRAMVEREVAKQVKQKRKAHWSLGRAAAVALAATMALGTTVFAGVKLYHMRSEKEGNYGLISKIEGNTEEAALAQQPADIDIPNVKMEATYLPEGMSEMAEEGIYCYEGSEYTGGFSVFFYRMDMGDDAFETLDKNVISSEELSFGGHDGIYFVKQGATETDFSQHIYLSYPEVHYVLDLYIGNDVEKEDALKFAGGIRLTPTEDATEIAKVRVENWSGYIQREEENAKIEQAAANGENGESEDVWDSISKEEFEKTLHKTGESFSLYREFGIGGMPEHDFVSSALYPGLEAKVTEVKVTDNLLSVLSADSIDAEMKKYMAEDGSILPIDVNYLKWGDGINRTDEVVKQEKVTPKFVCATVEYTNHGTEALADVLVQGTLLMLEENGNNVTFYQGEEISGAGTEWDVGMDTSNMMGGSHAPYFKLTAEKTEKNHIIDMKPGETATLQVGFYVTEEQLSHMYLNIDPYAIWSQFSETGLDLGYIDIRR